MLELDQVSKRLGSFQLRNITIQIPTGYLCGLAGENGAGKTSLLHMLLGLYRPDSGTVRIDGKIYEENEIEIRQQTGIVLAEDLLEDNSILITFPDGSAERIDKGTNAAAAAAQLTPKLGNVSDLTPTPIVITVTVENAGSGASVEYTVNLSQAD